MEQKVDNSSQALSEHKKIKLALDGLPSGNAKAGKIFLTKLLDKNGPEAFLSFVRRVDFVIKEERELTDDDLSKSELALLRTVKPGIPRRSALKLLGASALIAYQGIGELRALKEESELIDSGQSKAKSTRGSAFTGAVKTATGGCLAHVIISDALLGYRLASVCDAVDAYLDKEQEQGFKR